MSETPEEWPQCYVLVDSGRPVRRLAEDRIPEVLRADGKWEPLLDVVRYVERTEQVDPKDFEAKVQAWLGKAQRKKPS
jgi:hypothetical protein